VTYVLARRHGAAGVRARPLAAAGHDVHPFPRHRLVPRRLPAPSARRVVVAARMAATTGHDLTTACARAAESATITDQPPCSSRPTNEGEAIAARRSRVGAACLLVPFSASDLPRRRRRRDERRSSSSSPTIGAHTIATPCPSIEEAGYDVISAFDGRRGRSTSVDERKNRSSSRSRDAQSDGYGVFADDFKERCAKGHCSRRRSSSARRSAKRTDLEKGFDAGADDHLSNRRAPTI